MSLSIRWKLLVTVGLPLLVSYTVIFALDYQILRNNATKQAEYAVSQEASAMADRFNTRFMAIESTGWSSARLIAAGTFSRMEDSDRSTIRSEAQRSRVLRSLVLQNPLIGSAAVIVDIPVSRKRLTSPASGLRGAITVTGDSSQSGPEKTRSTKRIAIQVTPSGDQYSGRPLGSVYPGSMPPWFADESEDWPDAHWSEPYQDPDLNYAWAIAYVCPIHDNNESINDLTAEDTAEPLADLSTQQGPRVGVLTLIVPLERLQSVLAESLQGQAENHPYALFSAGSRFLAQPNPERLGTAYNEATSPTNASHAIQNATLNNQPGIVATTARQLGGETDEPIWLAVEPVKSIGGSMAIAIPESEIMGPLNKRITRRAFAGVIQIAILVGLVYVLSVRLVRPIEKLNDAVQSLSQGDLEAQASVDASDEIGDLARAFNKMVDELREHVDQITEQTAAREKVESELRIAREIQVSLLPHHLPVGPGSDRFEMQAVNRPARQIAGDFYDYFFDKTGRLIIIIADVSGKGVPAALLMAVTRTLLRHHATAGRSPLEAVRRTGEKLYEDNPGNMFVTLFMLRYDPATGEIVYVNAGHPKPCLIEADGTPSWFGDITAPLQGIATAEEIGEVEEARAQLTPGQSLLLFTDGVTEARNPRTDTMLGEQGLVDLIHKFGPLSATSLCDRLAEELTEFQNHHLIDDLTVVAIQRLG